MAEALQRAGPALSVERRHQGRLVPDHELHQRGQVGAVAIALHIGLGEGQRAAEQNAAEGLRVANAQRRLGPCMGALEKAFAAVRQREGELASVDPRHQRKEQTLGESAALETFRVFDICLHGDVHLLDRI
jgi:hypothetical protein